MLSAATPVFLFTISSICARFASSRSASGTTTSAVSPVRFTITFSKPFASRRSSAAASFSVRSVMETIVLIAFCFSSSLMSLLLMIACRSALFWERTCSLLTFACAAKSEAPVSTASPGDAVSITSDWVVPSAPFSSRRAVSSVRS